MAFDSILTAEIASGQPVIGPGGFGQKTKDNFDFLNGQIGSLATDDILNGSFEVEDGATGIPANWDRTLFAGGAGAFETTAPMHGAKAYKFTHPGGGGNGGGTLESDFFAIGDIRGLFLEWLHYVTAAGMHETVEVEYFTAAQVSISTQTIYDSTSNPTSPEIQQIFLVIPATARFLKVKLIGGDDDVDVAGDSFWDGIRIAGIIGQDQVGASAIGQTQIKTSSGEVSTVAAVPTDLTLPGGTYGFYPQIKTSAGTVAATIATAIGAAYLTNISLHKSGGGGTAFAKQRYVTASGEIFWYFILRDKGNKAFIAGYAAPDHPCFGNGGDPDKMSHPFPGFNPNTQEIVVVQAPGDTDENGEFHYPDWMEEIVRESRRTERGVLEVMCDDYKVDEASRPSPSNKPITVGFKQSVGEVMDIYHRGGKATLKKVAVDLPSHIKCRALKKKV